MLDAIEAMRVALGPGVVLNYVMQGLWHPARRVREIFWQIYSSLYMGAQDALVPYYPTSEFLRPNDVGVLLTIAFHSPRDFGRAK